MDLTQKIALKKAQIGVIGLGYVGLPLVIEFCKAGFSVTGFDIDAKKVALLRQGKSYIKHISGSRIAPFVARAKGRSPLFSATTDFSRLSDMDCILVCVPTPLNRNREPDMTYVFDTTREIARHLRKGQLVVLESTTYPGTTDEDMRSMLEASRLTAGKDFYLAFSPEREDPNNSQYTTAMIPKVVGGYTRACLTAAAALYGQIMQRVVPVSSTKVAEAAKLLENIYRSVNIALVNELKVLFDRMGIDVWEVIEAAKTKPFGFQAFYPGPGLGGHCIIGDEIVLVKNCTRSHVVCIGELFESVGKEHGIRTHEGVEFTTPSNLFIRSIAISSGEQSWKQVTHLFRRQYDGPILTVTTNDNRTVSVTDRHLMLRIKDNGLETAEARQLEKGDILPLSIGPVSTGHVPHSQVTIDLIDELDESWSSRVRVRPRNGSWKEFKEVIYAAEKGDRKYDWIRDNVLPLAVFKRLEQDNKIRLAHEDLVLATGRGGGIILFPAVVRIDESWARLIGYYLSEGCATRERGWARIRLAINRDELELYEDIKRIIDEKGLSCSDSLSLRWKTRYIRLNSPLLGWLLVERLQCGTDSYTMTIPGELLASDQGTKRSLLIGLFRGDGDVHLRSGMRCYRKNTRQYTHHDNSLTIGYFSINKILLHQALYLLQEFGICPALKKNKPRLLINGHDQINLLSDWFVDDKGRKLEHYLKNVSRPTMKRQNTLMPSAAVKNISMERRSLPVYSVEVADTHTFAVSQGIYVHNCIPIDPFYLTWKAREYEVATRFIELAGEINTNMPNYVVQKLMSALNDRGTCLKGSKILVLGVAYKPNVDDDRESPAFVIMELIEHAGATIDYHDPYIPKLKKTRKFNFAKASVKLTPERLRKYDAVVIVTNHANVDYKAVEKHARLIIDTRNALKTSGVRNGKIYKA